MLIGNISTTYTLPNNIYLEKKTDDNFQSEFKENSIKKHLHNLICDDGYLQSIYNDILSREVEWLTGWEISRFIYDKLLNEEEEEKNKLGIDISGFFGNIHPDFILGFLYYGSVIYKHYGTRHKYFTYNSPLYDTDENGTIMIKNKQFISTKINTINTIEIDNVEYTSPSVCRYINNHIRANTVYLNFSILNSCTEFGSACRDIRNILPTIFNLNSEHGILVTPFIWKKKVQTDLMRDDTVCDNTVLFVYILAGMFANVTLMWLPWEDKIWALCFKRKDCFDKVIYADLMESTGFKLSKIKKKYSDSFKNTREECIKFDINIQREKEKIISNIDQEEEYLIKKWLQDNEEDLENITMYDV